MRILLAALSCFLGYMLVTRLTTRHLDEWLKDGAPYWKMLAAVYLLVLLTVCLFVIVPLSVVEGALPPSLWLSRAHWLGVAGVGIRIAHDVLMGFFRRAGY